MSSIIKVAAAVQRQLQKLSPEDRRLVLDLVSRDSYDDDGQESQDDS